MFDETKKNNHGLKYNPFKSCIIPRPIAWITTISIDGIENCAPYSFFNGVASDPPMIMFANNGPHPFDDGVKDTMSNIRDTKEFVVNISTYETKAEMNKTCAPLKSDESEIAFASLPTRKSNLVRPKSLAVSPINMECKFFKFIELPSSIENHHNAIVIGEVIGIYIDDNYINEGIVDVKKIKPLSRLGYMDYSYVENIFSMSRPE